MTKPSSNGHVHFDLTKKGITLDEYARLKRRMGKGDFLFFPDYLKIMSCKGALMISFLICRGVWESDKEGWISCPTNLLHEHLRIGYHAQRQEFKELEEQGIIQQKKAGNPRCRHIRIITDRIDKLFDERGDS